ncbi:MAG: GNAT family N-acetyltransferase [Acidobacteriota bacterium]|nr:GNAT family N-acetyltransferase [Acidobacteriota bacterium]
MNSHLRVMTPDDIPAALHLVEIAKWNQTRGDWGRFLDASPQGCFVAEIDGDVAGTVATICYEDRFAWIGMVLVDPARRGQGIGTKLLEKAIEHLDARGIPSIKLDATPQGKPLYEKLGFVTEYELERWQLQRTLAAQVTFEVNPLTEEMLDLDREVFGADRGALLRSVASEHAAFVLQNHSGGKLTGYSLGRRGGLADHLGPWVAQDEPSARRLLDAFLTRSQRKKVFVDVMRSNSWAMNLLREYGLQYSRTLTRMYRGHNDFPGRPEFQGAILGPEYG